MRWLRDICSSHKHLKQAWKISKLDMSCYHAVNNFWNGNSVEGLANSRCLASHVGYLSSIQLKSSAWRSGSHLPYDGSLLSRYHIPLVISRKFWQAKEEPTLSRDWLVSLWLADKEMESYRHKRKQRLAKHVKTSNTKFQRQASSNVPLARWFSGTYHPEGISIEDRKPSLTQPPLSQSATGILKPSSPEELKVAPLLARSNLLITRNIEWANLMLGFEQENRYAILDPCYPQAPVGFIMEQSNVIARQLLRTRRPFVAYITDGMGNELFRVRRPFWWITSTIFAEIDGKEIGVVHRRWHLWRRVYDLYLGNRQFAVVENPGFWYWTFTLKDADGNVLAEIDRNWRGVGFELFTDAGQYVIRFGDADQKLKTGASEMIQELEVARPLTLSERAVALALAVSLDNDYFSRHGGWGLPFVAIGE